MSEKITVRKLQKIKDEGKKFTVLTAYDYSTAKYLDEAGIEVILIGDSLAMVALGYENTYAVGVSEMALFTGAVSRGAKNSLIVTDMPFTSYTISVESALNNIGQMVKNGANAVKIEGCNEFILEVIRRTIQMGVPVMGHIGFTPQSQNVIGGHIIQGKTSEQVDKILQQAKYLQDAGVFAIVLEMMPEESAKYITQNLKIPTISCGAGRYCDAQVMVSDDLFGKYSDFTPKFARKYVNMKNLMLESVKKFRSDVMSGNYPNSDEIYTLPNDK